MSTLNASSATIGLDYQSWLMVPGDVINDMADRTVKDGDGKSHFAEIFNIGWQMDYFGDFSNYSLLEDAGRSAEYPSNAIVSGITASNAGKSFYEWGGFSQNLMQKFDNGTELSRSYLANNDTIFGGLVSDRLSGFAGNDNIDGGAGTDTAAYFSNRANYSLTKTADGWSISGGNDGSDTLTNIEHLQFADKRVALDIADNALETLQFIGVIAPSLQGNLNIRGTILSLFDQGKSMQEMSQLALDLGLITSDNTALVKTVFKNVFNTTADPDQGMTNLLVGFVEEHGDANFLAMVAGLNINVDLVGLQQSGMEFML